MSWKFDFNNFLRQPLLMEKYLYPYEKEINAFTRNEKDVIEQGILLWNCIHFTVKKYQERNPEWIFVKHEDLSLDPCSQFRLLYERLNLEFTRKTRSTIERNSGIKNPTEHIPGRQFRRNSRRNIHNWKDRLNRADVEKIRRKTVDLSSLFYSDSEW